MTQNIYDNPNFFAGYSQLGRSVEGLDGAAEWPALRALLPDLHGRARGGPGLRLWLVLPLGARGGRGRVVGLDVSENMLARARTDTTDPAVSYARADLEHLDCRRRHSTLLIVRSRCTTSSIWTPLLGARPPGAEAGRALVFSVEHPIYTAPSQPGWSTDADGHKTWPVDGYLVEGHAPRTGWPRASSSSTAPSGRIWACCCGWVRA